MRTYRLILLALLLAAASAPAAEKGFSQARAELAKGLRSSDPDERSQAVYALDGFDDEDAARTLVRYVLARDDRAQVIRSAIQLLGAMRSEGARKVLVEEAAKGPWEKRARVLEALGKWRDAAPVDAILLATYDEDPRVRISAVLATENLPGDRPDTAIADSIRVDPWPVRSAAIYMARQRKAKAAVPALIERLGPEGEKGRLLDEVRGALVRITGEDFGYSRGRWLGWWMEQKGEPPPEPVLGSGVREEPRAEMAGVKSRASRILYVLALNDSMNNEVIFDGAKAAPRDVREEGGEALAKWAKAKSKLDYAKLWISWSLRHLAPGTEFGVVTYGASANSVFSGFESASTESTERAVRRIESLSASGNANLWDAVREVFAFTGGDPVELESMTAGPEVVFFVSDGTADTGEIREAYRVFEEAERWNRFRQIEFDTFGVGRFDSRVLADLAGMIPGGTVRGIP